MIDAENFDVEKKLEEFSKGFRKFLDDTRGENQLEVVIRGHLYVESELDNLLKLKLKEPRFLFENSFMFNSKLKTALALGLIKGEEKSAYSKLNKLRNDFAHNLNYELTEKDFNDIFSGLSSGRREEYDIITANDTLSDDLLIKFRILISVLLMHLKHAVQTYELTEHQEFIDMKIKYSNLEKEKQEQKDTK